MEHPTICFGVSRHNVIIPLKVVDVEDHGDGCFGYSMELNHPEPTSYMKTHLKAEFKYKIISPDSPLCDRFTRIRLTLGEAKSLVTDNLHRKRNELKMEMNGIDKQLANIDEETKALEAAIGLLTD